MEAARENKVKRVVVTSSLAAVINQKEMKKILTHDDFSADDVGSAYEKSKTIAEKAAWNFVKNLPDDEKFELCVINPGFIVGSPIVKCQFSSADTIKMLMMREVPGTPALRMPIIDVVDCARSHLNCITIPEAANKRYILSEKSLWFREIGACLY